MQRRFQPSGLPAVMQPSLSVAQVAPLQVVARHHAEFIAAERQKAEDLALAQRIAEGRGVQVTGVPQVPMRRVRKPQESANWVLVIFVILIVLSRFQGLSYEQIGQIVGAETGTVKVRVFRAMKEMSSVYADLLREKAS